MSKINLKKKQTNALIIVSLILFACGFSFLSFSEHNNSLKTVTTSNSEYSQDELNTGDIFYEDIVGNTFNVFVSGDYAYIATYWPELVIIDISDPTDPGTPIYVETTGITYDVFVTGDYAYVADGESGLAVIDISNSTNPNPPIYYEDTTGEAVGVFVCGDYAYVADQTSGLAIIDISNPTNPGTPIYGDTNDAQGVYVEGDYAYVADWLGLAVIDISNPTNPSTPIYGDTLASDVFISGDYAYVAARMDGLAVINISDPTVPGTPVYKDTTYAIGIYVEGDYAYIADGPRGLAIIDISNPTNPGTPNYQDTPGWAYGVFISGEYAYIANGGSGLAVIKIGEIIDPTPPIYEVTTDLAYEVFVSGDYAYVADAGSGLAIINITNPTDPGSPIYEDTTGNAYDIFISGDYAYVADGGSGLAVIDISNPSNPGSPIYEDTTGSARSIFVSGDYAYLAAFSSGLAVIDISNPSNPGSPIYEDTSGSATSVFVSGDFAYVADGPYGLAIIDISNPTNPGSPVYEDTAGSARSLFVSGDYAYMADGASGLAIIDISDPTNPRVPVYEDTSDPALGVFISGDYAYIADGYSGLAIIKIMIPWYALNAPLLNSILPNPDYDKVINLEWNDVIGATNYSIYRDTSAITTMTGKTPIATISNSYYQDIVSDYITYYYVIVASNGRGKSWISNCQSVNVIIDTNPPSDFSIYSPIDWINDATPTIIGKFYTAESGINKTTVQYAYSITGDLTPTNWIAVDGIYEDATCTDVAEYGDTGWIYVRVLEVPFNQESEALNTIRFRATDMSNNLGTQATATVINVDITSPASFLIESPTDWVDNLTPTVVAKFSTGLSGVNLTSVQYAYSITGNLTPTNWMAVDGVYEDAACADPAENGDTGWIYARVLEVPFNQDSGTLNTIRLRATDMANNLGTQTTATIIKIDTSIEPPTALNIQPIGWTTVNSFNITWVNPVDLTGIAGVYYKLDAPPTSDTDGTYIAGVDITEIIDIKVSGAGNHTIYIWLKDNEGNIDFTKHSIGYLCLKVLSTLSGGGGGDGGKAKEGEAFPVLSLIIIGVASTTAIIGIALVILKKRGFFSRGDLKK